MQHRHRIGKAEMIPGDDQRTFVRNVFLPDDLKIAENMKCQVNQPFEDRSGNFSARVLKIRYGNSLTSLSAGQK
ncbi:MAG: hypothetical protein KAS84_08145 [Anaerolineales bacterium]|nr:hypothetical protein [Anaerolineales bacterium]